MIHALHELAYRDNAKTEARAADLVLILTDESVGHSAAPLVTYPPLHLAAVRICSTP